MAQKERKLTKAEERRLARFREKTAQMEAEGWQRHDLTASPATANTLGSFYGILLCVPLGLLFVLLGGARSRGRGTISSSAGWGCLRRCWCSRWCTSSSTA